MALPQSQLYSDGIFHFLGAVKSQLSERESIQLAKKNPMQQSQDIPISMQS